LTSLWNIYLHMFLAVVVYRLVFSSICSI